MHMLYAIFTNSYKTRLGGAHVSQICIFKLRASPPTLHIALFYHGFRSVKHTSI